MHVILCRIQAFQVSPHSLTSRQQLCFRELHLPNYIPRISSIIKIIQNAQSRSRRHPSPEGSLGSAPSTSTRRPARRSACRATRRPRYHPARSSYPSPKHELPICGVRRKWAGPRSVVTTSRCYLAMGADLIFSLADQ